MADIIYGIRYEMAMTTEDILARRTRILFLDAHVAIELAPMVSRLLAREMGKDAQWEQDSLNDFLILASQYIVS